jgi:RHS repeat-associated protein
VIERWQPEVASRLSMVNILGVAGDVGDKYTGLDRFGRVVEQRWTRGTAYTQVFQDRFYYTYDRNGNRLTRTNAFSAAFSETYSYDALNQLQSFARGTTSSPSTTQNWQFDALGNWTAVTTNGVAESRTANAQNELTQVGSAALTYSPTGNLTTDAQGRTLSYDAWNRLVSVQNAASTQVARYEYDGLNRRIVEQTGTLASPAAASAPVRDIYFSRDWQALEERVRTSTGTIPATADTRYLWSPVYVDAMIARDRNADGNTATGTGGLEQRVYAVQDANWNTTAIITATGVPGLVIGTIISRFIYSPYGDVQVLTRLWETPTSGSTPAAPWSHLFQGLKFTDVTALAYVRHRDYSASLGRFIERDPIGFDAGDNNWYRFVANGPTGKTDPSGLQSLSFGSGLEYSLCVSSSKGDIAVLRPDGTRVGMNPTYSPPPDMLGTWDDLIGFYDNAVANGMSGKPLIKALIRESLRRGGSAQHALALIGEVRKRNGGLHDSDELASVDHFFDAWLMGGHGLERKRDVWGMVATLGNGYYCLGKRAGFEPGLFFRLDNPNIPASPFTFQQTLWGQYGANIQWYANGGTVFVDPHAWKRFNIWLDSL